MSIPQVWRHHRVFSLALAFVMGGALWRFDAQAGETVGSVEPADPCFVAPPAGFDLELDCDCGYVALPEDSSVSDGRKVKLGFLRINSRADKKNSPLFMLAGGPGSSLIRPEVFAFFSPGFVGSILETRDVVVLDQRGTKHSVPVPDCPDYHALAWTRYSQGLSVEEGIALGRKILGRCVRETRRQGIDLAKYNGVTIAADLNAARQLLGYDKIVCCGASYASQLGQHLMRSRYTRPGLSAGGVTETSAPVT